MVNLSALNTFQQLGLAHKTNLANIPIKESNAQIAAINATLPPEEPPHELQTEWTVQSFADAEFAKTCDGWWAECQAYDTEVNIIPFIRNQSYADQLALRQQFELPNVIPDEYLAQLPQQ